MFNPVLKNLKNLVKLTPLLTAFLLIQIQACKEKKEEVRIAYSITYDLNGGTGGIPAPQNYEVGNAGVNLANGTGLTQKGFVFGGWSEVKNGLVVPSPYTPKSNVILYAIWVPVYTVAYDLNKGSGTPPPEAAYITGKEGITLDAGAALSRDNFAFVGWSESPDDGKLPLASPYKPTANVTLYAIWKPIAYTVTFDLNYGEGVTAPPPPTPQIYTSDGLTLPLDITREFYTFSGWSLSKTETTAPAAPYKPTANVTLYAIWKPIVYTVTFDLNYEENGAALTPPVAETYTTGVGNGLTLPLDVTRAGYLFKGWSETREGDLVSSSSYTPTADVTLYAIWRITYKVTFALNYETEDAPPDPQIYDGDDGLTLPTPIRVGYGFKGWAETPEEVALPDAPYKPTANVSLHALWGKSKLILTSSSYSDGGDIPDKYRYQDGGTNSPQFSWSWTGTPPANIKDYVIVLYDASRPSWIFRRPVGNVLSLAEGEIMAAPKRADDSHFSGFFRQRGTTASYEFKIYAVKKGYNINKFGTSGGGNGIPKAAWWRIEGENSGYIIEGSNAYSGKF